MSSNGPREGTGDADLRRAAALALTREALGSLAQGSIVVSSASRSMVPLFRGGERIHWRRPASPPRRGDVLIFVHNPGPVVHRVVGRYRDGLRTKGDGRPGPDVQPVLPGEIVGVVEAVETGGRRFALTGGGARAYALAVTACSLGGWALHAVAVKGDAVLRRALPGWGDRRFFRAPAWWVQHGAQQVLHAALFRACHRGAAVSGTNGGTVDIDGS
jgi:hypothetical protein